MIAEVMKMREEEKKRSSQDSSIKRFFKKRWVFPAIYIASAAIILTAVLWYQNGINSANDSDTIDQSATDAPGKQFNEPAIEVNKSMENFVMPVKDADSAVIKRNFYDVNAKSEEQEAALVFYNNRYHENTGIDIGAKDDESFDVVASLSGTVTNVSEDVLLGNVIEIEHEEGIVTQYQSIKDIAVQVGEQVKQGQVIAKAGQSLFDEEAGVHVHFEIRKDDVPLNPQEFFQKPLSAVQELDTNKAQSAEKEDAAAEEEASDETPSADDNATEDKKMDSEGTDQTDGKAKEDSTESKDQTNDKAKEGSTESSAS